jgi:arginase
MAAATLLGWCHAALVHALPGWQPLAPERLLLVGGRDLDPPEEEVLRAHPIGQLTAAQVREPAVLDRALDELAARTDTIYLHIDLDVLDPVAVGPVNAFAAPGGLALADAVYCVAQIAARRELCGITLSAYDPAVDARGAVPAAAQALLWAAFSSQVGP